MKVVIPMAGYGTRMRPHTYSRPKPLISVAGYPMLRHLLDTLEGIEIDEYIFIVGYLGDQIEAWIDENYDFKATFVVQEELIGQAHAIYLAREHLDGPCIVLFSDTLFEADVAAINETKEDGLIFVQEVEDPRRFGVVKLDDAGHVTQFIEKPDSMEIRDAVIGLYYIKDSKWMIRAIETQMERNAMTKGEFYIADAFQIMIEEGADFSIEEVDVWLDTGKPETVLETNRWLLDHGHDNTPDVALEGVTIVPPVYVHPDARIKHAVIGPYASVGKGCRVEDSIVANSIVDNGAVVTSVMLDSSLIGRDAHVEGRFVTLNVGDSSSVNFNSC